MSASEEEKIILVDENATLGSLIELFLQRYTAHKIECLSSIDELEDDGYDLVFLNLSYYGYAKLLEIIGKVRSHRFRQMVVFSNLCFKCYPGCLVNVLDSRISIICKRMHLDKCDPIRDAGSVGNDFCNEKCAELACGKVHFAGDLDQRIESLSSREKEILGLICRGFSSKEIAEDLFITERTVYFHRENMLKKMGLERFSQLTSLLI